jgi:predicted nucleic acid-binding protein
VSAFVDTSGLYALLVRTESSHGEVFQAFRKLLQEGRTLMTTSYVLVETVALLQHRLGLAPVRAFTEHLLPVLSVEWVSEVLHRKGTERLLREDRRRLSLVDCVSLEFIRSQGLRDVLALDAHFAEAGYRLLPPAQK